MGWIERCYQTYEKNLSQVGKPSASIRFGWEAPTLLPVAHTTQKVNVEVSLTADGAFLSARRSSQQRSMRMASPQHWRKSLPRR